MATIDGKQTSSLIVASKVTGATLYNLKGEQLGSVHDLMIDKRSGNISYAIISFGGFLGLGTDYYPLPWKALRYDMGLGGYVTDITGPQLEGAPTFSEAEQAGLTGDDEMRMYNYYSNNERFKALLPFPNSI